jgi:rhodanese-related sulfurtransferase
MENEKPTRRAVLRSSVGERLAVPIQALIIILLASLLGIGSNLIRKDRIPFISHPSDVSGKEKADNAVTLAEAKERFDSGMGFFIDARSADTYRKGHILNALNLPEEDFEARIAEVKDLIPDSSEFTVIVYCDGEECEASTKLEKKLEGYGYKNVRVFFGGWNEWVKAEYPIEGTPE